MQAVENNEFESPAEKVTLNVPKFFPGFTISSLRNIKDVQMRKCPIQHETSRKRGTLAMEWASGDNAVVYTSSSQSCLPIMDVEDDSMLELPTNNAVVEMKQFFPNEFRKLISSSYNLFCSVQRKSKEISSRDDIFPVIVHHSRQYRNMLKRAVYDMELNLEAAGQKTLEQQNTLDDFIELLKVVLAIWHLFEVAIFQSRNNLSVNIAEWVYEHYATAELYKYEESLSRLLRSQDASSDPIYWSTVYSLVLCGHGTQAFMLLSLHPKKRFGHDENGQINSSFESLQYILENIPSSSTAEDIRSTQQWQEMCSRMLNQDMLIRSDPNLQILLKILCGHEETLLQFTSTWYELFAAQLLFSKVRSSNQRLENLMAKCIKSHGTNLSSYDCIVMAILENDVNSAIRDIDSLGVNWFTCHLGDLLSRSGHLKGQIVSGIDCSLHEFFLLQYALEIGSIDGLWQISIGYLKSCPRRGPKAIEMLLERELPETDLKAEKLIKALQSMGLHSLVESTGKVRGAYWKSMKQYGNALYWFGRANHTESIESTCEAVIDKYFVTGELTELHSVVNGVTSRISSSITHFMERLRNVLLVLEDSSIIQDQIRNAKDNSGDLTGKLRFVQLQATRRFAELFASDIVPKKYIVPLLLKVFPLLKISPPLMDYEENLIIIKSIQRITSDYGKEKYISNSQLKELMRMRAHLSSNAAKSIILECTNTSTTKDEDNLMSENLVF